MGAYLCDITFLTDSALLASAMIIKIAQIIKKTITGRAPIGAVSLCPSFGVGSDKLCRLMDWNNYEKVQYPRMAPFCGTENWLETSGVVVTDAGPDSENEGGIAGSDTGMSQ